MSAAYARFFLDHRGGFKMTRYHHPWWIWTNKQTWWGKKCRKRSNIGDKKLIAKGLTETRAIYKAFQMHIFIYAWCPTWHQSKVFVDFGFSSGFKREIQGIPGSFSSCCVCECNSQNTPTDVSLIWIYETDLANIESVHLNACWMRAEQPHGACRVLAPDVIHSDSDNYFSGAKKTAVTSESLISVCSHFQPLNRSCEINIYMSQIPVERAMYVF